MDGTLIADGIHVRLQSSTLVRPVCSLVMGLLELLLVGLQVLLAQLCEWWRVAIMLGRLNIAMQPAATRPCLGLRNNHWQRKS